MRASLVRAGLIRSRFRTASWLAARLLLGTSVALQYLARLSLPPTVLAAPERRPWAEWVDGWLDSAGTQPNGTCARLGRFGLGLGP